MDFPFNANGYSSSPVLLSSLPRRGNVQQSPYFFLLHSQSKWVCPSHLLLSRIRPAVVLSSLSRGLGLKRKACVCQRILERWDIPPPISIHTSSILIFFLSLSLVGRERTIHFFFLASCPPSSVLQQRTIENKGCLSLWAFGHLECEAKKERKSQGRIRRRTTIGRSVHCYSLKKNFVWSYRSEKRNWFCCIRTRIPCSSLASWSSIEMSSSCKYVFFF